MGPLDGNLLSWVTFLPLGTALVLGATGRRLPERAWKAIALAGSLVTFLLSLLLWSGFDATRTGYQFVERAPWLPHYGIHWFAGIDGISLLLVLLTTFLVPLSLLGAWNDIDRSVRSFSFHMLPWRAG